MMPAYAAVYAMVVLGIAFAAVTLIAAKLLRPKVEYARKLTTYECGMPAQGTTEVKLNIRFYVFALLFVLFDAETLFVYPWAVATKTIGPVAIIESEKAWCMERDGVYNFLVQVHGEGQGHYVFGIWARKDTR